MLLSNTDGWPLNYTVETSMDDSNWSLGATVQLCDVILRIIRFASPIELAHLRVNVTAPRGGYTRTAELSPVYAARSLNSTPPPPTHSPSSSSTTTFTAHPPSATNPPSASSSSGINTAAVQKKSNNMGIVAGVLGGLAAILLGALAYFLWLLRKRKNSGTGIEKENVVVGTQNNPERSSPFDPTYWTELGTDGQQLESFPDCSSQPQCL